MGDFRPWSKEESSMRSSILRTRHIFFLFTVMFLGSACIELEPTDQRIVVLSPNHTEILYALGVGDRIVGWTRYCNYPPEVQSVPGWVRYDRYVSEGIEQELEKEKAVVSPLEGINMALIDSLKPTLILSTHAMLWETAEKLETEGYHVMHFEPHTLEDVFAMIEEVGIATGKLRRARRLTDRYRAEVQQIRARTMELPKVSVYFEIHHDGPWALGSASPMDEIIECAGGVNIFADVEEEAFVAEWEDIVERNPDVILTPLWPGAGKDEVTTIREVVTRDGAEQITAVKNSRVYHYDSSMLKRPGPRQVVAIKKMAHLLHPYYFENPDDSVDPWELGKIDATYPPPVPLR